MLALIAALALLQDEPPPVTPPPADLPPPRVVNLHPKPPEPVPAVERESAIRRGVDFLLAEQNKDGSWGSAERTKDLNIIAGIGSHHAFRVAVSSLVVCALIEVGDTSDAVKKAIERGETFLLDDLSKVRRDDSMLIYNVWTHAYGIQALVRMHGRLPDDADRQAKIKAAIRVQLDMLKRYESVEGGWGYYDFNAGTKRPAASSTSFVNAAALIAMREAKDLGVEPDAKVLKRAIDATVRQRKPDFTYLYGTYLKDMPVMEINLPSGSLGRSQACNAALRVWGDAKVTDKVIADWLDRLISRNGWLDMGRKKPIPHESFALVAGYFYYFGHYYAARCIALLPPEQRPFYQDHLARIILSKQERDGCWWDYPLYNYHQPYGTAFALMTLVGCRKAEEAKP